MEFPETLLRLVEFPTKEKINLIYKGVIYPINKSLAVAISPHFYKAINSNPMLKEIYLPINEKIDIEAFFKGQMIERKLFFRMSIILNNKELMKKWKKENEINYVNVIDHLKLFIKYNTEIKDMEEEIEFIGEHFEELENKIEFKTIPSEYLSEIFKKLKGIKSEEKIKDYIMERIKEEENEDKRKKLIKSIEIRGLNNEDIKKLMKQIKYEDLSEQLFLIIQDNLLSLDRNQEDNRKELEISVENVQENQEVKVKHQNLMNEEEEKIKKENEEILMKKFEIEYQQDSDYQCNSLNLSQLHIAAKYNSKEIGEILISKGADINVKYIIYQITVIKFFIMIV